MIDFILPIKLDSYNRSILFSQTLMSLINNSSLGSINKIVIVDDCSLLDITEILGKENILLSPNLVYVKNETQKGVGGSKNIGYKTLEQIGTSKYLYIFDGDVYFTKGWDLKLLNLYEKYKNEFKIVAGGVHPFLQPRANEGNHEITSHDAISGWSWLLERETFKKYGFFADNSIGTGKSEDWEYCQRVRNDGFKVGCINPQIIAHCGITNTEGEKIVGYDESINLAKSVCREAYLL